MTGRSVVIAAYAVLLLLWLWLYAAEGVFQGGPSGRVVAADFAMFVAGSRALQHGQNPYDQATLYHTERSWLARQHLPLTRYHAAIRVGNPPLFFWSLQPLADLPFPPVAYGWLAFLALLTVAGLLAVLRFLGWQALLLPAILFVATPATFIGLVQGNVTPVLLAALGGALVLMPRHPRLAGLLLLLTWLKPPVGLPLAGLIVLFTPPRRVEALATFIVGSVLLLVATLLATGPESLLHWAAGLVSYSNHLAIEPNLASLAGLYARWAPGAVRLSLDGLLLAAALALTFAAWWPRRAMREIPFERVAWLWYVWFLASPYTHFYDEALLAAPTFLLLGRDGRALTHPAALTTLFVLLFSLLLISPAPFRLSLLSLPLLLVTWFLWRRSRPSKVQV